MASTKFGEAEILATFYDEGVYTTLYSEGAVTAAFGSAAGQPTYAICQDGSAVAVKDADNLLAAGRCISCDHEAQASIRIMPICCATVLPWRSCRSPSSAAALWCWMSPTWLRAA